jgi:hypothetical protein
MNNENELEYEYSNYGNNEGEFGELEEEEVIQKLSIAVENTLNYNTFQKAKLKKLYNNYKNKNSEINRLNKEISNYNQQFANKHPELNIRSKRVQNVIKKELEIKQELSNKLKKEKNTLFNNLRRLTLNENINILLQGNINRVRIKINNSRSKLLEMIEVLKQNINDINKIIKRIETVLKSNMLNQQSKDKTKITMIFELERIRHNIISFSIGNSSSKLFQNINYLLSFEHVENTKYKNFQKLFNDYKKLLKENSTLIMDVLSDALQTRSLYQQRVNELIEGIYEFYAINDLQRENIERKSLLINELRMIKNISCISLDEDVINTIDRIIEQHHSNLSLLNNA